MHCLKSYHILRRKNSNMSREEQQTESRKVEIKTNATLADYIKELKEDVKLSEYNLREKSLMCSSIWAKWLSYLFMEKEHL